ncbi:hypothetical protein [Pseudobacteriovorax antillogorgiicola]|uniref:Lipoprotein n=1 Tax=Pseudobacteriovorax antillogorgiicola TaxID=1513793 RepID=A0A1Y6BBE8_9BACT|nr:hypothetical protein [Pseudobacteriovorax antillogorgiicola]TCS57398.1 hypothetical protein EDD56_103138 [Pseudobacteriovorax antillogorgiicola]SMF01585.1 hypothetical protein SAMN06296036_103195 [Pseudobacteriovorax antillogorgiicola]
MNILKPLSISLAISLLGTSCTTLKSFDQVLVDLGITESSPFDPNELTRAILSMKTHLNDSIERTKKLQANNVTLQNSQKILVSLDQALMKVSKGTPQQQKLLDEFHFVMERRRTMRDLNSEDYDRVEKAVRWAKKQRQLMLRKVNRALPSYRNDRLLREKLVKQRDTLQKLGSVIVQLDRWHETTKKNFNYLAEFTHRYDMNHPRSANRQALAYDGLAFEEEFVAEDF